MAETAGAARPKKRSLTLDRHRTSVSIEDPFWDAFRDIAARKGLSVNGLAARIDRKRGFEMGLATAIRLFVLEDLQARLDARAAPRPETRDIGLDAS